MQINKNSKILKRQQENKQGKQNKTKWAKTMVKQFTEEEKYVANKYINYLCEKYMTQIILISFIKLAIMKKEW